MKIFAAIFLIGVIIFLFDMAYQGQKCQDIADYIGVDSSLFKDHCIAYYMEVNGKMTLKSVEAKHIPFKQW
jgi:hypothetical protein